MVHEAKSVAEKKEDLDICHPSTENLLLLVAPSENEPEPIADAR